MTLTFNIPAPPSVNNLFANVPGKGRVKSERYRIWANAAKWSMVVGAMGRPWEKMRGPVAVEIINGNGRQDIDNCAKGILDLLTDMDVIADDKQVVDLHIMRGGKPREAIVTVRAA